MLTPAGFVLYWHYLGVGAYPGGDMARIRKSEVKAIAAALPLLLIGGIILFAISGIVQLFEAMGWVVSVVVVLGGLALFFYLFFANANKRAEEEKARREERRAYLLSKYRDGEIVEQIMAKRVWQGQTSDQLRDSIGAPMDTDEKVLKTKRREVWKYHHRGGNRYGLRITLDNGLVVGWDEKL